LYKVACGLAKRFLKHTLVETFVEKSPIIARYFGREANDVWNGYPLGKH
jgi:lambda repressor-like predicted transcriptional regulator